jgi:hypothetical protein
MTKLTDNLRAMAEDAASDLQWCADAAAPVPAQPQAEPYAYLINVVTDAGPTKLFTAPSDPRGFPVYTHPAAPVPVPPGWMPIETAPVNKSIMLFLPRGPIYCGRKRYGNLGEPQQDAYEWRCDSSGRFANPTHWMPLPSPPGIAASPEVP